LQGRSREHWRGDASPGDPGCANTRCPVVSRSVEIKVMPFRCGCRVGGRYRLLELVARGGTSEVWSAEHPTLGVEVALKVGRASEDPEGTTAIRFRREAEAAASLRSRYFAQVYDFGFESGRPYIAMELLAGCTLRDRLERDPPLSLGEIQEIVDSVARALDVLHRNGFVHRDIKPGNIFLNVGADGNCTKLLDFGLIKDHSSDVQATSSHVIVGSPSFMSPEQARGNEVDATSDIWSLGAVVFRLVTGRSAFGGDDLPTVLANICSAPLPLASRANPRLGADWDRFFAKAMARNPMQRFQRAGDLLRAFHALSSGIESSVVAPALEVTRQPLGQLTRSSSTMSLQRQNTQLPWRSAALKSGGIGLSAGLVLAVLALVPSIASDKLHSTTPTVIPPSAAVATLAPRADLPAATLLPPVSEVPAGLGLAERDQAPVANPPSVVLQSAPVGRRRAAHVVPVPAPVSAPLAVDDTRPAGDTRPTDPVFGLPIADVR
jgi:serine/threonine protein kinase